MSSSTVVIDLHGLTFIEAKTELLDSLEGHIQLGYSIFEVIHGFKGGTVLRDYVRISFRRDFDRSFKKRFTLSVRSLNNGSTLLTILPI